jgi:Fe2+ or Zn2+ uptake regulation protein
MRASSVDQIILKTLSKEHAHLTSLQVFEEIRERLPAVNQSTVYRSLERLVHIGKVSVFDMGTGSAVFELLADGLHHHLVCQKCGTAFTLLLGPYARSGKPKILPEGNRLYRVSG